MTVAGVLLAAGGGSRFEGATHKLLTPVRGRPLVSFALEAVTAAGFDEAVVVTGAVDLDDLVARHAPGATVLRNDRWSEGMATSLQIAVAHARALDHDGVVVGLADQPGVTVAAWSAVASSASPIAVAVYDGVRGNPVRLAAEVWHLLPTTGDAGARVLMRERPDLVGEVACEGTAADVDTVEDLRAWS